MRDTTKTDPGGGVLCAIANRSYRSGDEGQHLVFVARPEAAAKSHKAESDFKVLKKIKIESKVYMI
jgi:hypothetical protein